MRGVPSFIAQAARVINESDEPMSRLARQRLLKQVHRAAGPPRVRPFIPTLGPAHPPSQAKREERLRLKDEKRVFMMQRKRELRLQRGRK